MEEWKQIEIDGIKWNYEVSSKDGAVRNMKTGRILKQHENIWGYLYVRLSRNDKQKNFTIHRLVAIMFIPNPHGYDTVDHINHNKHDNRVENLRWLSHKNNSNNGRILQQRKVKCIELDKIYDSMAQASRETNVSVGGICDCCKGKIESIKGLHFEYVN